ncbi:uncharacterized protein BDV17DRAFT_258300 [Aspergillus undulatus]|uniref:uncharacterized protein n=1 Tax=Aspergillus undulatus TaxID=1810928 RepID=UPI003CCDFAEC
MSPIPPSKPSDGSFELSPTPARTKEENQERAFTAASRRKDRTLDARIESANRASALHKKRTGRALKITRAIVAAEGMYEEIDEHYEAKRLRYRQVQDAQIDQDFDNSLLVGLAGMSSMPSLSHSLQLPSSHMQTPQPAPHMPSSQESGLADRRASTLMPNRPIHGARHLSLGDISQLRISSGPRTDPLSRCSNVMSTPGADFSPSYSSPIQMQAAQAQDQVPNYVNTTASCPIRQQPPHAGYPSNSPEAYMGGLPMNSGQFRNRLASAPTIPSQAQVHSQVHSQAATPAPPRSSAAVHGTTHQHNRVRSEPGPIPVSVSTPKLTSPASSSSYSGPLRTNSSSTISLDATEPLPTPRSTPPHTPTTKSSCPVPLMGMNMSMGYGYGYNPGFNTNTNTGTTAPFKYTPEEMQNLDFHVDLQISPTTLTDEEFDDFRQFASGIDGNHFLSSFDSSMDPGHATFDFGLSETNLGGGAEVF